MNYHDRTEISSTQVKAALTSPIALHVAMRGGREETDAMRLGTAAHEAILEPAKYAARTRHARIPWTTKAGKEQKEWWESLGEKDRALHIFDKEEEEIEPLRAAWDEWHARWIAEHGRPLVPIDALIESEVIWRDEEAGPCRCKPDALVVSPERGLARIVSVKTAREGWPTAWARVLHTGRYNAGADVSEYHYIRGISRHFGIPEENVVSIQVVLCKASSMCYAYNVTNAAHAAATAWRAGVARIKRYQADPVGYVRGDLLNTPVPPPWVGADFTEES